VTSRPGIQTSRHPADIQASRHPTKEKIPYLVESETSLAQSMNCLYTRRNFLENELFHWYTYTYVIYRIIFNIKTRLKLWKPFFKEHNKRYQYQTRSMILSKLYSLISFYDARVMQSKPPYHPSTIITVYSLRSRFRYKREARTHLCLVVWAATTLV